MRISLRNLISTLDCTSGLFKGSLLTPRNKFVLFLFVENRPSKPITLLVKLFEVTWHRFLGLESDFMTHYPGKWSAGFLCRLTLLVAVNRHRATMNQA